jgi:hypothetical protein
MWGYCRVSKCTLLKSFSLQDQTTISSKSQRSAIAKLPLHTLREKFQLATRKYKSVTTTLKGKIAVILKYFGCCHDRSDCFACVLAPQQSRRCALLLGSGVSRSAGIPTSWEIVLDLIRKAAVLEGTSAEANPEEWYRSVHQKLATEAYRWADAMLKFRDANADSETLK